MPPKPLFTSTTVNCFIALAAEFTRRFHLGEPCDWISHCTAPHILRRYPQPTMAVKFTLRPSYYRVTWNPQLGQFEIYWLSARD